MEEAADREEADRGGAMTGKEAGADHAVNADRATATIVRNHRPSTASR